MKVFHYCVINVTISASYRITYLIYVNLTCFFNYPYEVFALWYFLLQILLSLDVHPNPGPTQHSNNFSVFLSFCNWNLNDIISLCKTCLNDSIQVPENILPDFKFHSCNHPDRFFIKKLFPLESGVTCHLMNVSFPN